MDSNSFIYIFQLYVFWDACTKLAISSEIYWPQMNFKIFGMQVFTSNNISLYFSRFIIQFLYLCTFRVNMKHKRENYKVIKRKRKTVQKNPTPESLEMVVFAKQTEKLKCICYE